VEKLLNFPKEEIGSNTSPDPPVLKRPLEVPSDTPKKQTKLFHQMDYEEQRMKNSRRT
jgi:hypothetical protein